MKLIYKKYDNELWKRIDPFYHINMPEEPDFAVKALEELASVNPASRRIKKGEEIKSNQLVNPKAINKKTGKIIFPEEIENHRELPRRARLVARKGDTLLPTIKTQNFKPAMVVQDKNYIITDYFAVLVPKKGVDPFYLNWVLRQNYSRQQLKALGRGNTRYHISLKDIKNIKVLWLRNDKRKEKSKLMKQQLKEKTPAEKEKELVEKLDSLFAEITGIKKQKFNQYKQIKHYPYDEFITKNQWDINQMLLTDLKNIFSSKPEFKIYTLSEIAKTMKMGVQHRDIQDIKEKYLIKGKDIKSMNIITENSPNKRELKNLPQNLKKYQTEIGDLLIRVKSKVGIAAVVEKKQENLVFYNDLMQLKPDENKVKKRYLTLYLNSFIARKYFKNYQTDKNMSYITKSNIKKIPILVPETEKQQELIEEMKI